MTIEFSRFGSTYQCAVAAPLGPPPRQLTIPFRPCVLKPPFELTLAWLGTDEVRGIELYRPIRSSQ
jgi:hypothetical protein